MKPFPFKESDAQKGQKLLDEGKIGEILFSEGTYQIEVIEKTSSWPFLQIDDEAEIKDSFCTCDTAEKSASCPHLAAAYLSLFRGQKEPLHVRFRRSLWNRLCEMAARRHGYEVSALVASKKGHFEASSLTNKVLFSLSVKNKEGEKKVNELLFERPIETEESSLKFSNLPSEELLLWREGRPSDHLKYELSFWSDLAKTLFLKAEEKEPYTLSFDQNGLPRTITLDFPEFQLFFYIAKVNWPELIPALSSVKSPLKVRESHEIEIESIFYNEEKRTFTINSHESDAASIPKNLEQKGIEVGDYLFYPNLGFFSRSHDPLLHEKEISVEHMAEFLTKYPLVLRKYLKNSKIQTDKLTASYTLKVDAEGSLIIKLYLFDYKDFEDPHATTFGPWVYLPKRGFYLVDGLLFQGKEKRIPRQEVSDFVSRHRLWLNEFEGFETHLLGIESRLSYTVDKNGKLIFQRQNGFLAENGEMIDYGDWIYLKERGFYAKLGAKKNLIIKPGTVVEPAAIPGFLKAHREELEQIEGFWTHGSFVEKCGLKISLLENETIKVDPMILYFSEFRDKQIFVYEEFLFVPGEGFAEIPPTMRLPHDYMQSRIIEKSIEPYFVAYDLPALSSYIFEIDPRLERPEKLKLKLLSLGKSRIEGEWLVDLFYQSSLGKIELFSLWERARKKKPYAFTSAGLIQLSDPRFNWLKVLPKKRFSKDTKRLKLTTLEWIRLLAFETIDIPQDKSLDKRTLKYLDEIGSLKTKEEPDLTGLLSTLRPYQATGVKWLFSLYFHGLSGMLCDEMGLGKTHQAMALITALLNRSPKSKILVVCPTSVVFHWEDLLARFLPRVRALVYYGISRSLEGFEENFDLIVTSYGTLRSEKEALHGIPFDLAVFDEIQAAKNRHSQTHKALRALDARVRLGLTGTPIENNLMELKALFDLILPSYLPGDSLFRELFVTPIEKHYDEEKRLLLGKLINPFTLRRKKDEVLKDLPERIEEISYCEMSPEQKRLYKESYFQNRDMIMHELEDQNKPPPYLHIFSLLTKLKQICDHPALVTKEIDKAHLAPCGKWDLFVELLTESLESGQKVVVFSQYLDMLTIIENYLESQKVSFAAIRGATRDRKRELEKFRDDPECRVFVGSLQATGTGIDLISASIVIHYDRWWNPAKEEQATARVHRMGQKRGVQVFKLVTKKSIEEHIHELIERKKSLQDIVAFDEHEVLKTFNRDEIITLLQEISLDVDEIYKR